MKLAAQVSLALVWGLSFNDFAVADFLHPGPQNLKDVYTAALKRSEVISVQQELLIQADELEKQAKSALYPTISGSGTFLHQPAPSTGKNPNDPFFLSTLKITADQPLFRGFRDFAALRQKGAQADSQNYLLQSAARQLFYDTATAFYNVLALEQDLANYGNEIEVNKKRLVDLQAFFRIGRSRNSEILTFKANISSLEAQAENTRMQLEAAKDVLAFLTGESRDTSLKDDEATPPEGGDLNGLLARIEQRPDVKTAASNLQAFEENLPIARGGHLPTLDLIGDYYPYRPGTANDIKWDVQLALSVPIFQGGAIQSQIRQAQSAARQYTLLLSQSRRVAEQEIRTFYDNLVGSQKQLVKLNETADLTKLNYEAEVKDYRNNLVTNLDVLQAISTFQSNQRALDRQKLTIKLAFAKLQASAALRAEVEAGAKIP